MQDKVRFDFLREEFCSFCKGALLFFDTGKDSPGWSVSMLWFRPAIASHLRLTLGKPLLSLSILHQSNEGIELNDLQGPCQGTWSYEPLFCPFFFPEIMVSPRHCVRNLEKNRKPFLWGKRTQWVRRKSSPYRLKFSGASPNLCWV